MSEEKRELRTAEIQQILELLPHRYPFLLVDRVIDMDADKSAIGIKNVTFNEPHFTGHFPGQPIMPGVLIIEAMAQTAGVLCISANEDPSSGPRSVFFLTIDGAKFRKPVVPGDRLELHVTKLKSRGKLWKYMAVAMVDGEKVAEAEISAMISDRGEVAL
ncbi:MAG: 3-hydroxyacyl-ACP dehydratase FabZ [Hyphomicrobiaceae bacterium]|nr:3-hydroxyacyl-ACP dehydratase FabZ [Hyphomicrobiaceae bacterium]